MSNWPPIDNAAIYSPPPALERTLSPTEIKARLAAERVREGLPAGEGELEEVLARRSRDDPRMRDSHYTCAEAEEADALYELDGRVQEILRDDEGALLRRVVRWRDGRRVETVYLTEEQNDLRRDLVDAVGTERLIIESARLSYEEIGRHRTALFQQLEALAEAGIEMLGSSFDPDGAAIEVCYMAPDPEAAERILYERFGDVVRPRWQGASGAHRFQSFPFASWMCEKEHLTVFYGLPHNGQLPAGAQAFETEQAVIVSLRILSPRGAATLLGGFTPSHATVTLEAPLGTRTVIDDSANRARPHWTHV